MFKSLSCFSLLSAAPAARVETHAQTDVWANLTSFIDYEDDVAVAKYLNEMYFGFDPSDDKSPLGVPMVMNTGFKIYCSEAGHGKCYRGWTDCRMPTSMYNHRVQLDQRSNSPKLTRNRNMGFVLNPKVVESQLLKCAYMFDGSTTFRFNGGCGCESEVKSCDWGSAFFNMCGGKKKTCTIKDTEVKSCACDAFAQLPSSSQDQQCYFKGAAYNRKKVSAKSSQIRQMLNERTSRQDSPAERELYTEMVIDTYIMQKLLESGQPDVVMAFVYKETGDDGAAGGANDMYGRGAVLSTKQKLEYMRNEYTSEYGIKQHIPVLKIDDTVDVTKIKEIFSVP